MMNNIITENIQLAINSVLMELDYAQRKLEDDYPNWIESGKKYAVESAALALRRAYSRMSYIKQNINNKSLPEDPPEELLHSMALRYDHALGCDGYYDQPLYKQKDTDPTHEQRYRSTINTMRQLYEEVSGYTWEE